ncbi:DNA polymerase III subunit gamma/tau [Desulfonatronovibrio magnus]|uniref:DNA polymerase III subunit gamma/tau n=1 Tax=Desulfonatronovibrio magnus TaxID=698827 RepID=UPI0005EB5786|nr:DNA polymerase III subunit gamma/tau [Desulfonatronovibrio magnus]RQD55685.1 MAG: DNA polymerase III subunit gamma/tau [Desulfonatronovibrio sp. MSAO_Bac4]
MARVGLTAKYRPQRFKDIVGQDFIKKVLSTASQQDKPANAYLFSGTRGVGKTTAARIMAKAINCRNGPDFEPCNSCSNCRQISKGAFPDVMEIDAASHTGVDNVRKLREDAVYVPMSGKYKVIIIDEGHMLSKGAFNALLKTLEEPPRHCVFIMATTAPEKFPVTVVSRCQHYVFKMVPLDELVRHLSSVLDSEKVEYDLDAVKLIARRGAGSVRDSMSILGQVIALGGEKIDSASVRDLLGLAGHEVYARIFQAVSAKDLLVLHTELGKMLEQGLDINFFLLEFSSCWRNVFLISQAGPRAASILDLPEAELTFWQDMARAFPGTIIHAAWQMVIEEQKNIVRSNEPATALELLLFNLACLPELLPVDKYTDLPASSLTSAPDTSIVPQRNDNTELKKPEQAQAADDFEKESPEDHAGSQDNEEQKADNQVKKDWDGFVEFCNTKGPDEAALVRMLKSCPGIIEEDELKIVCKQSFVYDSLNKSERQRELTSLTQQYFGSQVKLSLVHDAPENNSSFRTKALNHPVVKKVLDDFDARIIEIRKVNY